MSLGPPQVRNAGRKDEKEGRGGRERGSWGQGALQKQAGANGEEFVGPPAKTGELAQAAGRTQARWLNAMRAGPWARPWAR